MATQPILHNEMNGGMDGSSQTHLLKPNQWKLQHNMRVVDARLAQVPHKKQLFTLPGSKALMAMANIPVEHLDYGNVVGITSAQVWRLGRTTFKTLKMEGGQEFYFTQLSDGVYRRFGTCLHNNRFFFVNEVNPVMYTDGVCVRTCQRRSSTFETAAEAARVVKSVTDDVPAGRYCSIFFDHLVVGAPTRHGFYKPWDVAWSNLGDYSNFTSGTSSEADHYTCSEFQSGDELYAGITGLQNWKEYCVIYTENAIYAMHYTGLPRVVLVRPLIVDYGNGLPYAVSTLNDTHAFIDTKHKNFFYLPNSLSQTKPAAFGNPIASYFFSDLNPDFKLAAKTYAYRDKEQLEVVWVYVSNQSSGDFDKAVAFNWDNNTWSVRDVEAIESFCHAGRRAICTEELGDAADTQFTGIPANQTVESGETLGRIWGTTTSNILVEETETDSASVLLQMTEPQLETGDYIYGSLSTMKEVNRVLLDASATQWKGILVEVSARKSIGAEVIWEQVGMWTPELAHEILAFVGKSGKVIRYRFTGVAEKFGKVRGMVFNSFEETVSGFGATK